MKENECYQILLSAHRGDWFALIPKSCCILTVYQQFVLYMSRSTGRALLWVHRWSVLFANGEAQHHP